MNNDLQGIVSIAGVILTFLSAIALVALIAKAGLGTVDEANASVLVAFASICGSVAMLLLPRVHVAFGIFLFVASGLSAFILLGKAIANSAQGLEGGILFTVFISSGVIGYLLAFLGNTP